MVKPLIGFNVLEQIIDGQPERLIPTLVMMLCNVICLSTEETEVVVNFIQTAERDMPQGRLRTGEKNVVVPAGKVTWIRRRVPPIINLSDSVVLFEADKDRQALEQLDVLTVSQNQNEA